MSKDPMQRLSDLEAQNEQLQEESATLKAENRALREVAQKIPSAEALAEAIGTRLVRVEQNLREDFIGKFAGSFLLATETITNRVVAVEERHEKIEARQSAFEGRITTHMEQVGSTLNQADAKQVSLLRRFDNALKQHQQKNDQLMAAQGEILSGCQEAAEATRQAAARCESFDRDYKVAAASAKLSMQSLSTTIERDLTNYLQELKSEAFDVMNPVMERVKYLTESQYKWRAFWLASGLFAGIVISGVVAWSTSPGPATLMDASRWRTWQADNFTKDQADRINKVLKEIEDERAKKAGQEKKNNEDTPFGS